MRQGGSREGVGESSQHSSRPSAPPSIGSSLGTLGAAKDGGVSTPQSRVQALAWPPLREDGASSSAASSPRAALSREGGRGREVAAGGKGEKRKQFEKSHRIGSWATSRFSMTCRPVAWAPRAPPRSAPLTQRLRRACGSAAPAGPDRTPPRGPGQVTGPGSRGQGGHGVRRAAAPDAGRCPGLLSGGWPAARPVPPPAPPSSPAQGRRSRRGCSLRCHDNAGPAPSQSPPGGGGSQAGSRAGSWGGWKADPLGHPRCWPQLCSCAGSAQ